jgi:hypothetical protein
MALNSIVMSIFGLSLLDNFGFEFIKDFMIEIRFIAVNIIEYLSNTRFYQYLNNLFSNKEEIPSSDKANKIGSVSEIKSDETRISEESRRNPKIAE